MLQRIQSVYLFLGAVAIVVFMFLPLQAPSQPGGVALSEWQMLMSHISVSGVLSILLPILALIIMFMYDNLKRQLKCAKLLCLLTITYLIVLGIKAGNVVATLGAGGVRWWTLALPCLAMVFFMLAHRGINADKKLIESADRIR